MFAIQMRTSFQSDKELTTISVSTTIGHTKQPSTSMSSFEVFIIKGLSINTMSSSSISISDITSLDDETINDPVELAIQIIEFFSFRF